ncbi:MAG: M6 family metalloprotease domain-containing protein, partial [Candidatus Sumerlaeota bacterium]|nr:M6 family metalloprotease domain-containing protein [Candidatus Sumerlaeota bacterium]
MKRAAILAALLTLAAPPAYAHIANPTPLEAVQPDGTKVALRLRGDEFYNWKEDLNGFTVLDDRGWLVYAAVDANGDLAPTRFVLGRDDPKAAGLAPNAMPSPARLSQLRAARMAGGYNPSGAARASVPPRGTIKNLVVLCRFSDHTPGVNDHPQADYDVLFNQLGGDATLAPTGSVRDFYTENSFGVMDLQSTVVAWVTLPHTEAWYCNGQQGFGVYPQNAQGMVEAALNLVDPTVDFGQFDSDNDGYIDAIDIIHSGFDAAETGSSSNIWSHKWSLYALPNGHWTSNDRNAHGDFVKVFDYHTESALSGTSGSIIVRLAVICHETGHFFGLPDLYDTDGSSEGDGSWSLMANDWGFDFTGLHPPFFDAWSKQFLGWVAPTPLMASGVYVISQAETNAQAYRIDHWYPNGEYLLIENRQPVSFESDMPQGGLVVLHVDETKGTFAQNDVNNDEGYPGQPGWPQNGRHYRVAVLQADARYDLEHGLNRGDAGDAYFSRAGAAIANGTLPSTDAYQNGNVFNSDNTIADISAPGSAMSFTYQTSVPVVQHTLTLSRTGIGRVRADGILHDLPWAGQFFDGQSVQLNAVPEPGWFFRDWSGDLNGGVTPQTIVMDGDKSVTANFINRRIVHLTLMSTGRGVVKVNGQQVALPWQGQYLSGESIRLEAIANPGWYFLNWSVGLTGSQNPIDFVINNDLTALATFINTPPLTLSLDKTGNGEAKVDGALVTLPWQGLFRPGDTVTLDPAPGVNWYFLNWSGDMNG